MNSTTLTPSFLPPRRPAAASAVLRQLARLRHGTLSVQLPDGSTQRFGTGEPHAAITLRNWNACGAVLARGDIGLAESYLHGDWTTTALPDLLCLLVRNRRELEDMVYGSWFGRLAYRARHLLNRNSRRGSRRNIHAHYDLGNAFYSLWLDETMNYSAGLFDDDPSRSLARAQHAKVNRALTMANVRPGDRVLEIGCGWGALAQAAVCDFGARLTGVTLSTEQLAYAQQRLARAGATGRAELRLQDYRDIADAPFDAICSIEMVEAVGRAYWPAYFGKVHALLKPGGRACIQTIVIDNSLWGRYMQGTDFIQQYIFPGGCLPCPKEFRRHAEAAGLDVVEAFSFGKDYARTLAIWRQRFLAQQSAVAALGFDERFTRLWDFYLAYCEAAFACQDIDVVQYTLQRR